MILYHSANMERKEQCRLHLNREALLEQLYLAILPRYYSTSGEASKSSSIASFLALPGAHDSPRALIS